MLNRKRLSVAVLLLFTIVFYLFESINNKVTSNENGSPAGFTGSPGDNFLTCNNCHTGPAETFMAGWITSNIPVTGYVPGNIYTITATLTRPGHVKGGFEIKPEDAAGNMQGTLNITNGAQTKLTGGGSYVTQTVGGTTMTGGQKTWSFNWVAPVSGTGNITFYGAFSATNNGGNTIGDTTFLSTLAVAECQNPQQPSSIFGKPTVCSGAVDTFKVLRSSDATSYSWTLPSGWIGSSVDTFITVTSGITGGTISVNAINDCGISINRSIAVSVTQVSASVPFSTPANCPGGSDGTAIATASNGTGTYTYSWNTIPTQNFAIASGLSAGTYIVTATDQNGCSDTAQINITAPGTININGNYIHKSCQGVNNGSLNATVLSGGTIPFTYSWNTTPVQNTQSAINLFSGNYIVTVTDGHGCTNTSTVNLPQSPNLGVTMTSSPVSCTGGTNGSVNASPAGGVSPFTYIWNTIPPQTGSVATNLVAGNYSVSVTDSNGCTASGLSIVSQPTILVASTTFANTLCFNTPTGKGFATASGGTPPYSYSWNTIPVQNNDTAFGLAVGSYIVTVTDSNGCTKTSSINISQPPILTATTTPGVTSCFGGHDGTASITPAGGTGPYTFLWNTIPVQTGVTASLLQAGTFNVTARDANGCTFSTTATVTQPPAITASITTTSARCFGNNDGTATVVSSGGTGGHTYVWNNSSYDSTATATHLLAGVYSVIITDAHGCTKTFSDTVTQPTVIALQTSTVLANCSQSDGSATVSASGGTPGYTYSWSTVPSQTGTHATNLIAGIYAVTASDFNSCTQQAFVVINNSTPMTLNIAAVQNVSCFGMSDGSVAVTVTNAPGPVIYSWLPSHDSLPITSGLPAGNVSITVIDTNNCQVSEVIAITEPTPLIAYPSTTVSLCNGDSVIIGGIPGAQGGTAPYTFSWTPSAGLSYDTIPNPVAAPGSTTLYTMTVTDSSGCISTMTDTVIVNTISTPMVLSHNDTLFCTQAAFYQWYRNDTLIAGAVSNSYAPVIDGNYSVMVTDTNGCHAISNSVTVILSTTEILTSDRISVYPNPASNEVSIINNYKEEGTTGTLMTIEGIEFRNFLLKKGINKLDISSLPNGSYILHVRNKEINLGKIITVFN